MIYADFEFYKNKFGGTAVTEEVFPRFAAQASAIIDKMTFRRAQKNPEDECLKMCCCDLAETLSKTAETNGFFKQSESVGDLSYSLNSAASEKTADDVMRSKCGTWLPAEWLYRGVGRE